MKADAQRSLALLTSAARAQARGLLGRGRAAVLLANRMDSTGAPLVVARVAEELARQQGARPVRVLAPFVVPELRERLGEAGVTLEPQAVRLHGRLAPLQLALRPDAFVLLNTVAVYQNYQRAVLGALAAGDLHHAFWFIHEDPRRLGELAPHMLEPAFRERLRSLAEHDRLTVLVPSTATRTAYDGFLGTDKVETMYVTVDVPERFRGRRPVDDYSELRFLLVGGATNGLKGHLRALAAFREFQSGYRDRDPGAYRDFSVVFVGLRDEDPGGAEIMAVGASVLGGRLAVYPPLPHGEVLELTRACNAVICCSETETFALGVAEGMAMGHVVLRNDTGGREEQLRAGANGYLVDAGDVAGFAARLADLLDTRTASAEALRAMGAASQELVAPYLDLAYRPRLTELEAEKARGRARVDRPGPASAADPHGSA
jgi:glycosyltransferase involved in cell wall biosynthesis